MKPIEEYPGYNITEDGNVLSNHKGGECSSFINGMRILKPAASKRKCPYNTIVLCKNGKRKTVYIHHLMAEIFLGSQPFPGAIVRHLDGNSLNNKLLNLAWGSYSDDRDDQKRIGTFLEGAKSPNAKFTEEIVSLIREHDDVPNKILATLFSVAPCTIRRLKQGKTYVPKRV